MSRPERLVVFLGATKYCRPLDETTAKKFRALGGLGEFSVIGYSSTWRPQRFHQHADFYLLPNIPLLAARYAAMLVAGPALIGWQARGRGARIIVAQSPLEGMIGVIAKRICGLLGTRAALVVESHGDFEEAFFLQRPMPFESLWRRLRRAAANVAFRHADVLRAISAATRKQLERSCPGRPIVQFPTWTDLEVFFESTNTRPASRVFTVLYAGMITRLKSVHTLLEAVGLVQKRHRQIRTVIAGAVDDRAYGRWLQRRAREIGVSGAVRFVGRLTQRDLAHQMASADVLVLPSLSEGLGRVLLEAMASGIPVIASDVGGAAEIVEHERTGFLVPRGDAQAIAERILWLLRHPERGKTMGDRGREAVRAIFSADRYRQGYQQVFDLAVQAISV